MDRYNEYPHQFSGGMKQRVVIAMALACNPQLLLADEPTTALDVTIQAQVLEMMQSLKEKLGTSVLLITHDLGVVAETCDLVAVAYAGEIVEFGSLDHIFNYTAHPYTRGLFGSLPKLDSKEPRLKPIKGLMPDPTSLPKGCGFCDRCPRALPKCVAEKTRDSGSVTGAILQNAFWREAINSGKIDGGEESQEVLQSGATGCCTLLTI